MDKKFFRKRTLALVGVFVLLMAINVASAGFVGFNPIKVIGDIPHGIVWMAQNFTPSLESFAKIDTILISLGKTILLSIASSCIAAIFAYMCAVIGSREAGLGGPFPLIIRGIASVFRNIPVVAWAFILMFSFKQSEFTGFLALFLGTFGYLTRCFLESIDEVAGGSVEALRATGAGFAPIVTQAIIPMSITAVISWTLYMIETNIRDATLIGILTGAGIGALFDVYYKSFRYDLAALVILCIVVAVIACEAISNYVRRQII
ncbi:MAG: ABC transporter permease subunit [Eggerthellaceae bacterium]|nr:ABC transporter permease subunit [Eggerthellaceae bacterium]